MTEWMPKNPYKKRIEASDWWATADIPKAFAEGASKGYTEGCHDTAKKLLECLIKTHSTTFLDIDGHHITCIHTSHLDSMLKSLEEKGK